MKKEDFVQQVKPALECLPRWAVVAFAARVARRVTPLYHLIVRKDVEGVALGVAWAWTMAAEATGLVEHDELARKVRQATRTPFVGDWITGHMLAHGAGHVADCVLSTLHASNSLKPSEDALQAVSAAFSAMSQAISVTGREGSRDFSICKIDAAAQTEFVEASMADLTWLVSQHEKHGSSAFLVGDF